MKRIVLSLLVVMFSFVSYAISIERNQGFNVATSTQYGTFVRQSHFDSSMSVISNQLTSIKNSTTTMASVFESSMAVISNYFNQVYNSTTAANALTISTAIWSTVGSNAWLRNTANNVGIGTTAPTNKFEVNGTVKSTSVVIAGGAVGTVATAPLQVYGTSNLRGVTQITTPNGSNDNFRIVQGTTNILNIGSQDNFFSFLNIYDSDGQTVTNQIVGSPDRYSRSTYFNAGNVGIGTTAPESKLSVSTTSTSGFGIGFIGMVDALPTTTYKRGAITYLTSDNTVYIATETVTTTASWKPFW